MKNQSNKFSLFSRQELTELKKIFQDSSRHNKLNEALWEALEREAQNRYREESKQLEKTPGLND